MSCSVYSCVSCSAHLSVLSDWLVVWSDWPFFVVEQAACVVKLDGWVFKLAGGVMWSNWLVVLCGQIGWLCCVVKLVVCVMWLSWLVELCGQTWLVVLYGQTDWLCGQTGSLCSCWPLLYNAILRSRADSQRSPVILHEWIAFYSAFLNIHRSGVLTALAWLVYGATWNGCRLGAFCVHHRPCYFMHRQNTCYCGNTVVEYPNKSQHRKLTKDKTENSLAAPAGIWTRDLSITSPTLYWTTEPSPRGQTGRLCGQTAYIDKLAGCVVKLDGCVVRLVGFIIIASSP